MTMARPGRRLSAIMAADIVGYSRLVEADEAGTLTAIRTLRSELIDPHIAERHGRIVKLMGDGAIVEFGSVVDAVACAVAMQKAVALRQVGVAPERWIVFRIGVNLGDVVVEGEDLLGDGVNVAAQLEIDDVIDPADTRRWITTGLLAAAPDRPATDGIAAALEQLDPRSRRIVEERWLKVNDDGSGGLTLHDLAAEYGVSVVHLKP